MTPAIDLALARSHDPSWEERKAGASALGELLPDATAFERLIAMLDDPEDTAVAQQAATELTLRGSGPGLAAVAKAYATLGDDVTYFIAGALGNLWMGEGFPLPERLTALADDDDPDVVRGAVELGEYLHVE